MRTYCGLEIVPGFGDLKDNKINTVYAHLELLIEYGVNSRR